MVSSCSLSRGSLVRGSPATAGRMRGELRLGRAGAGGGGDRALAKRSRSCASCAVWAAGGWAEGCAKENRTSSEPVAASCEVVDGARVALSSGPSQLPSSVEMDTSLNSLPGGFTVASASCTLASCTSCRCCSTCSFSRDKSSSAFIASNLAAEAACECFIESVIAFLAAASWRLARLTARSRSTVTALSIASSTWTCCCASVS
mmetsp:Transcript_8758/g.18157  ORF Transcript_8758/g.18157 Transcript_8758/m.18157 type:complete len:204 (-) Transcript_8758:472-1083(-)